MRKDKIDLQKELEDILFQIKNTDAHIKLKAYAAYCIQSGSSNIIKYMEDKRAAKVEAEGVYTLQDGNKVTLPVYTFVPLDAFNFELIYP